MAGTKYTVGNRHGFTLIEMMIVMTLITVIVGLSTLFFANIMPSSKINAAARELSATIRYAHALSQIDGARKTLTIDLDAKQYGIEGRGHKSLDHDITMRVLDPFDGEVSSGIYSFTFQPTGIAQGGTVILGSKKKEVRIELDPVIGSVVVR